MSADYGSRHRIAVHADERDGVKDRRSSHASGIAPGPGAPYPPGLGKAKKDSTAKCPSGRRADACRGWCPRRTVGAGNPRWCDRRPGPRVASAPPVRSASCFAATLPASTVMTRCLSRSAKRVTANSQARPRIASSRRRSRWQLGAARSPTTACSPQACWRAPAADRCSGRERIPAVQSIARSCR